MPDKIIVTFPDGDGELWIDVTRIGAAYTYTFTHAAIVDAKSTLKVAAKEILQYLERTKVK